MENRAHFEDYEIRLLRFKDNPPSEIIYTLLISIDNFFNNEIQITANGENPQTALLFLGIHAVALTLSEGVFKKKGVEGYKLFLERFVDGNTDDTKFSTIANHIHNFRNVLAHQWLGASGYIIGFDYGMTKGWETREDRTFINPKIYLDHYIKAFDADGKIWSILNFPEDVQEKIKERLLLKFQEAR